MSSTYEISDALAMLTAVYSSPSRSTIIDQIGPIIADAAQSMVWNYADWRQTLTEFPPFWLVPLEQDYGPPSITLPEDFQGFRKMYLVQAQSEPEFRQPLDVKKTIEKTYVQGPPTRISYEASIGQIRVWPRVPDFIGSGDWIIDGTYKKAPVKITPSNIGSALVPIDDRFFDVYRKALTYAYLDTIGDPRAGTIQFDRRSKNWMATGELAKLRAALQDMAESEAIDLGDDTYAPEEPLIPYFGL